MRTCDLMQGVQREDVSYPALSFRVTHLQCLPFVAVYGQCKFVGAAKRNGVMLGIVIIMKHPPTSVMQASDVARRFARRVEGQSGLLRIYKFHTYSRAFDWESHHVLDHTLPIDYCFGVHRNLAYTRFLASSLLPKFEWILNFDIHGDDAP